jgi:lipoate-protein ligase A
MGSGRLIIEGARLGADNMAIDEMLLRRGSVSQAPTLRFYSWEQPTLSLGYFQPKGLRDQHAPSTSLPLVRRTTGGGAIVHDCELTYSLVIPISDRLTDQHRDHYRAVHRSVIATLREFGIEASLSEGEKARQDAPFLCFERRAEGDVVVGQHKVLGSAQRRHANALLQHGSLLLKSSPFAPSLPGIEELAKKTIDSDDLVAHLQNGIKNTVNEAWDLRPIAEHEWDEAKAIVQEKFGHDAWSNRR